MICPRCLTPLDAPPCPCGARPPSSWLWLGVPPRESGWYWVRLPSGSESVAYYHADAHAVRIGGELVPADGFEWSHQALTERRAAVLVADPDDEC